MSLWSMVENKWVGAAAALLCMAGCPGTDAQDDGSEIPGDPDDPSVQDPPEQCGERAAPEATEEERGLNAHADLEVAAALLAELGEQDDNILLSPYSVRAAFGQVYGGTQGTSRAEIEQLLGFEALGDRTHAVLNAVTQDLTSRSVPASEYETELIVRPINRSFFDLTFEDSVDDDWLALVQSFYGTCIEVFDMNVDQQATLDHVNGWVADQTNDLIPNLVKFLPETVTLIVVNALYFKAGWAVPFEASLTQDRTFSTWSGGSVQLPMMRAPLHQGRYGEGEGWQAVSMPYTDGRLEMVVILPSEGTAPAYEASMDATSIEAVFDAMAYETVDLSFPKLDLLSTWTLRPTLEAMGMSAAFVNGPDFDPIADGMMPIFEVFHDVAIAIDEEGTEAAAATAVVFGGDDGGQELIAQAAIVVDRTFYLAIRDQQAGAVLFFARIGDPTGG